MPAPLVVITGATHGIGRATAQAFAREGHALLLLARHKEAVGGLGDAPHRFAEVDVADFPRFQAAVAEAEAAFGPTDCLVNNAGFLQSAICAAGRPTTSIMTSTCCSKASCTASGRCYRA